jgi:hypothetical protein
MHAPNRVEDKSKTRRLSFYIKEKTVFHEIEDKTALIWFILTLWLQSATRLWSTEIFQKMYDSLVPKVF